LIKKLYLFLFVYDLNGPSAAVPAIDAEPWKVKLRKDIALLVLASYTLLIFNPVMPILADIVAHTFWEKEHLITVHKIYGANHVHAEIERAAHQPDKEKSTGNSKSNQEEYLHFVYKVLFNFSAGHFIKRSYPPFKFSYPVSYPDVDYPPPWA